MVRHVLHGVIYLHPRPVAKAVLQVEARITLKSHVKLAWAVSIGHINGNVILVEGKHVRCWIIKKQPMAAEGWSNLGGEPLDRIAAVR